VGLHTLNFTYWWLADSSDFGLLGQQRVSVTITPVCSFNNKNFQNFVPKVSIASPIDVLCANFVKFGRREIHEIVRYLPGKIPTLACHQQEL